MKIIFDWLKGRTTKPEPVIKHEHQFVLQYRTGNPFDGQTDVCKCDCGQWGIRHYGQAEYIPINHE